MIEIKFRGKRIDNGDWTYGWLVVESNGTAWISKYYHKGEWEQVDPETVGQLTSRHDANGKEIYEGDIVKYGKKALEVFWNNFGGGSWWFATSEIGLQGNHFRKHVNRIHLDEIEIIGNVHENLNLLWSK